MPGLLHRRSSSSRVRHWRGLLLAAGLGGTALVGQAQSVLSYAAANGAVYSHDSSGGVVSNNDGGVGAAVGGSTGIGVTSSTSVVSGACPSNPVGCASSSTTASLADAGLHAAITTAGSGLASSRARWSDALTFHVANAASDTRTDIVLDFHLTGAVTPSSQGLVNWVYSFTGPGTFTRGYEDNFSTGVVVNDWLNAGGVPGFKSFQVLSATATDFHLRGVVELVGADRTYGFLSELQLRCEMGTSCDYGNSAHLTLDLPAGVSFTSASGVFLSAAVPEPGRALLLALGLAGLAAGRGWRSRSGG